MIPLWTAEALAAATGGRATRPFTAAGVAIDSRGIGAGDLFVALRGPSRDGHAFVADALAEGAAGAVVAARPDGTGPDAPLLLVADTQAALEAIGRAGRARSRARIVGVTGSVGKTGTKEMLRRLLAAAGPTHASAASHNNHWGVPLTLARLPADAAYAVLEMGMNHAGEIRSLTAQARPHVALITWIAPAHLEFFPDVAAIADAKAEILDGLEAGGTAVLPRDSDQHGRLVAAARSRGVARVVAFGAHPEADWRLVELRPHGPGNRVTVSRHGAALVYELGVPGRHWALNSVAALAAVEALGVDPAAVAPALTALEPTPGRGLRQPLPVGGGTALLIDESYNANPASMRAALALLGDTPGRRIAALGDMLELGGASARLHAELADAVAAAEVDLLFTCGPMMRHLHEAVPADRRGAHAADSAGLVAPLRAALRPGDVLLVKGSLGSRMRALLEGLTVPAAEGVG